MIDNYILMHKDIQCGVIAIDRDSSALSEFRLLDDRYAPFLGNADNRLMKLWWNHRAVPGSRRDMLEAIRRAGCGNRHDYLAKNLALSISDTYWICPMELELKWNDVDLHRRLNTAQDAVVFHNGTSYDPNASLGGEMSKYWDMSKERPALIKKAYEDYGQQSVNELFATEVHSRQKAGIPYVEYLHYRSDDNALCTRCEAFTSETIEFIPAYEILRSRKQKKDRSDCDQYIDICEEHGIKREVMQNFIDYMILTDLAISNTDRHLQNFGVLRDADTMKLIGPAPLFDSGNSMFFGEKRTLPLSRAELLAREISSFHKTEEKMLKHVLDRNSVDISGLPSDDEVRDFYSAFGIPGSRADFIAGSYSNKLALLRDFQKGTRISFYLEKRAGRRRGGADDQHSHFMNHR